MKHEERPSFTGDWKRLSGEHKELFRRVVPLFNSACDEVTKDPSKSWPASLRVKKLTDRDCFAMTWSFSGPDGRATFSFVDIDGELGVAWRRIGDHGILKDP